MSEELKAAQARIACLEGEIAKRDARIVELESRYQRDVFGLNNEGDPIGGDPAGGYANDNARLRAELAATKAQGVVIPAELDRAFITGESCDGVYRVAIQSETLKEMQAVHSWLTSLNAAPVQQVSVQASAFASRAITHYEAALLAAFPSGSSGEVFNQWNEARRVLAAAPAAPAADAGHVFYGMDGNHP